MQRLMATHSVIVMTVECLSRFFFCYPKDQGETGHRRKVEVKRVHRWLGFGTHMPGTLCGEVACKECWVPDMAPELTAGQRPVLTWSRLWARSGGRALCWAEKAVQKSSPQRVPLA